MNETIRAACRDENPEILRRGRIGLEAAVHPASSADMDKALIIGASGGIGRAVSEALSARGVVVTGLSRSADGLDVTDESTVEAALGRLDGPYVFSPSV